MLELDGPLREEPIATDSMVLHELHCASLTAQPQSMVPAMQPALQTSFGRMERRREEFAARGKALGGGVALRALDRHEHAYHLVFGAAAGRSVDAFMQGIDWARVYSRHMAAVTSASEGLGATIDEARHVRPIAARGAATFENADVMAGHAHWQAPARVDAWAADLKAGDPVAVRGVHGHEVGRAVALRLRSAGIAARFLNGGLDAWRAGGQSLVPTRRS